MSVSRDITIGRDAFGNALVTGDNNQTFVFFGRDQVPEDLLALVRNGRMRLADMPEAVACKAKSRKTHQAILKVILTPFASCSCYEAPHGPDLT